MWSMLKTTTKTKTDLRTTDLSRRSLAAALVLLAFGCNADAHPPTNPTRSQLDALELFNTTLGRLVAREIPDVRVFVGVQEGDASESDAYAWTKCVPESEVFVVQVAHKTLGLPPSKVRYAAFHEACHLFLHRKVLCSGGLPGMNLARRREIENEADDCATLLSFGG